MEAPEMVNHRVQTTFRFLRLKTLDWRVGILSSGGGASHRV